MQFISSPTQIKLNIFFYFKIYLNMIRKSFFQFFSTHSKICIIGGGTGGINLATHLMRKSIPASAIRII